MCASPCKSLSLVNCLSQKAGKWRNICCVAAVHESALAARGALGGCHMRGRQLTVEAPIPPPTYTPTKARGLGVVTLVPPLKAACGAVCLKPG